MTPALRPKSFRREPQTYIRSAMVGKLLNVGLVPTTEVAILVRVAETCQHPAASVGPEAKIELSYTLALSRWAAMGKASSSLLVNFPKAFLTSVIRAARAASSAC